MQKSALILAWSVAAVATVNAQSTLNLTGVASGTSRFNDHFADSFAQVNLAPEGFYAISNPSLLYGSGYDAFPNNANFALGTVTYNDITGVGVENAVITALVGNWLANVDPSWGTYSTAFSGVTGTAQFLNGALTGLSLSASTTFTYTDGPIAGFTYAGTFAVAGDNWALAVDNIGSFVRHEWAFDGSLAPVPEPSTLALVGLGLASLVGLRRARR